jgi:hypothetical protein
VTQHLYYFFSLVDLERVGAEMPPTFTIYTLCAIFVHPFHKCHFSKKSVQSHGSNFVFIYFSNTVYIKLALSEDKKTTKFAQE